MKVKFFAPIFAFFAAFVFGFFMPESASAATKPGGKTTYSSYTVQYPAINNYYYQDVNHVVDVNNHYYVKHNYYVRDNKYVTHDLGYEKQYIAYSDTYQVVYSEDGRSKVNKVAQSPYVYTTSRSNAIYVAERGGSNYNVSAPAYSAPAYSAPAYSAPSYVAPAYNYNTGRYATDASGQSYYLSTVAPGMDIPHIRLGN
ncbi:MAG: hypothetical protein KIH69_014640 [Anaerolineae bacterium]|nr:hypothetical protein [Anaerolineae bacterium]